MAVSWFNIVPHAQWGKTNPSGVIAIGVTTGSAIYNTINNDVNGTGFAYHGRAYDLWNGPFSSQAEAKSSAAGASGWTMAGIVGAGIIGTLGSNPNPPLATGAKAGTAAGNAVNSVGDFLKRLAQANTWLRIGEGVLGILLILVGMDKLLGSPASTQKLLKGVALA